MSAKFSRCVLAMVAVVVSHDVASARIPPPAVSLDVLLKTADRIVVGRVRPGSLKSIADAERKDSSYHEFTLIVSRSLDGKNIGKEITVTEGSFPAKVFPADKKHPKERFLLTGYEQYGLRAPTDASLDLYTEQVWFLERFRDFRLRNPKTAPHGVDCFDAVQRLEHAGLIELFAHGGKVAKLRKHIEKEYKGKIPHLAIPGLYGSNDPAAGALVWDYYRQYEALADKVADFRKKELAKLTKERGPELAADIVNFMVESSPLHAELREYHTYDVFRTLNSLGRHEALKWTRKHLQAGDYPDWGALETLKRFQDSESVPRLLEVLKKASRYDEREPLILTLGEIGDPRAVGPLIDALADMPGPAQYALFQLTDIRFSPNGDYAKRWWQRNQDKPRWHWLKQGIEQDLYLLARKKQLDWDRDLEPWPHLRRVTCWHCVPTEELDSSAAWAKWWQANKDLPQERWILDSFKAVGHPIPDLSSKEAVDALVAAYNTKPDHWRDKGPVLDPYLHHYWCQRLLTRLTSWDVEDTHYLHYRQRRWYDYQKEGRIWAEDWRKSRHGVKIYAIPIPAKQPFTIAEEDRRLLCEDFETWEIDTAFKGPLVRKKAPDKQIVGTFEIALTNRSKREVKVPTKPRMLIRSGDRPDSGNSWYQEASACTSHPGDTATLRPGQSMRWLETAQLPSWEKDRAWISFVLYFDQRGAWHGHMATPSIGVKKENIREE